MQDPHDKLIVALDVPDVKAGWDLVDKIGDSVSFYKIGMELIYRGGLEFAQALKKEGKKIFIDAKLHDIPRTVLASTRNIERLGADILTLHGSVSCFEAIESYRQSRGFGNMKLCCITVLTSESEADLRAIGKLSEKTNLPNHVLAIAEKVKLHGGDGVVASAHEAANIRQKLGKDFLIITPGIRPAGNWSNQQNDDQKRAATPGDAILAGADYLVVGRPIVQADNPQLAAHTIIDQIDEAMNSNILRKKPVSQSLNQPLKLSNPVQTPDEKETEELGIPHEVFTQASNVLKSSDAQRHDESIDVNQILKNSHIVTDDDTNLSEADRQAILEARKESIEQYKKVEKKDDGVPQWEVVKPEPKRTEQKTLAQKASAQNTQAPSPYQSKWQPDND